MRILALRKLVGLLNVELISSLPPVIESNQALTASWRTDLWEGATIKPTEYENGNRYINDETHEYIKRKDTPKIIHE